MLQPRCQHTGNTSGLGNSVVAQGCGEIAHRCTSAWHEFALDTCLQVRHVIGIRRDSVNQNDPAKACQLAGRGIFVFEVLETEGGSMSCKGGACHFAQGCACTDPFSCSCSCQISLPRRLCVCMDRLGSNRILYESFLDGWTMMDAESKRGPNTACSNLDF